jgi:ADP-heptose:LPS heptosyltransferase
MESLLSEHIVDAENAHCRELLLTEDEKSAAAEFVARANLANMIRGPIVAIAPGSKWPSKTWSIQRLKATVSKLIGSHTAFPIVFGGEEDQRVGKELLEAWNTGANAAGALTVRQAAAALEHCDLFLGNDTGTMHLAANAGVPCVAIFASNNWAGQWYPAGHGHRIFRTEIECEGCQTPEQATHHLCLDMIEEGPVYAACCDLLDLRIPAWSREEVITR